MKRRDRYAPVRESGFHRRGTNLGATTRAAAHLSAPDVPRPKALVMVESACGAVPELLLVRFPSPTQPRQRLRTSGQARCSREWLLSVYLRHSRPEIHRVAWPGSARPHSHSLGMRRALPVMRTLAQSSELSPIPVNAGGSRRDWSPTAGGANCCGQAGAMLCGPGHRRERQEPARRGVTTSEPAGRDHDTPGPPLNDLAPRFAPQRHRTPDGSSPQARAKEPVREAMAEIFPSDWNCATSVRQQHTGSDLGFCLRVERRTFSLRRKRSSDR